MFSLSGFQVVLLLVVLQSAGVFSAFAVANVAYPSYEDDLQQARIWFDSKLENQIQVDFFVWLVAGYFPFLCGSVYLLMTNSLRIPMRYKPKLKRLVAVSGFGLAVFLLCGGTAVLQSFGGVVLPDSAVLNFLVTPLALVLLVLGCSGLLLFTFLGNYNGRGKRLVMFAVASGFVVLSVIYLELLLTWSYSF